MRPEVRIIEDKLQKLIGRMKESSYKEVWISVTGKVVNELQRRGVNCVDKFVQKLLNRINDKEAYLDILMEGRFAVILARNGLSEITFIKEERRRRLPDLKANYNRSTVYLEVTRRRPTEEDERLRQSNDPIWIAKTETGIIIDRIQEKLRQLKSGEINVVVYCSETVTMGIPDIQEAFKYIKQETCNDPRRYRDLSGVIFTESAEVPATDLWEFYLLKNNNASRPLGTRLAQKLESLHEKDSKK